MTRCTLAQVARTRHAAGKGWALGLFIYSHDESRIVIGGTSLDVLLAQRRKANLKHFFLSLGIASSCGLILWGVLSGIQVFYQGGGM